MKFCENSREINTVLETLFVKRQLYQTQKQSPKRIRLYLIVDGGILNPNLFDSRESLNEMTSRTLEKLNLLSYSNRELK